MAAMAAASAMFSPGIRHTLAIKPQEEYYDVPQSDEDIESYLSAAKAKRARKAAAKNPSNYAKRNAV
jgi:hypothetical protein